MKKIIITLFAIVFTQLFVFADDIEDVKTFFNSFVNAANTYSKTLPNYYLDNAKIIRVVLKKDGTKQAANFAMSDYKIQMAKSEKIAKLVGYKNTYKNITVTPQGKDFKVSAKRYPNKDKVGLSCYFVVTKTSGGYKIKVESMDTPVQDFLKHGTKE